MNASNTQTHRHTNIRLPIGSLDPNILFRTTIIDKITLLMFNSWIKHPDCFETCFMEIFYQRFWIREALLENEISYTSVKKREKLVPQREAQDWPFAIRITQYKKEKVHVFTEHMTSRSIRGHVWALWKLFSLPKSLDDGTVLSKPQNGPNANVSSQKRYIINKFETNYSA